MNARIAALSSRTFAAFQHRNFRLYLGSQLVSFSGTWMQSVALAWLVLQLTGSGTALGTVLAMQFLPTMFLAPIGGMIADRLDKRTLIIGTQSTAGILAMILGIITLTGAVELWMVYAIAAGMGTVTAVDNPSRQTFVMEMVGPEHIANAVTLNSVTVNGARAIGPALGGVIIATLGVGQCFVINSVSYLAVIGALLLIDTDALHPSTRSPRARGQLREGFRYVWHTPVLRTTLAMLTVIGTLTYEFQTTLPLLAEFTFHGGASALAAMTALMGVGAVVGGLAVATLSDVRPSHLVIVAAVFGGLVTALAAMPTLLTAYLLMPLIGAASIAIISMSNATLQLNADPMLRGRVMALFSMSLIGSTPIGGPIVGWIGEHVDPRMAILVGGLAAVSAAAWGAHSYRTDPDLGGLRLPELRKVAHLAHRLPPAAPVAGD